jgi:hypothetical protein
MTKFIRLGFILSAVGIAIFPVATNAKSAKTNYILQCQGCHKANGEGIENSVPDLRIAGKEMLDTDKGREFFIRVPGSAYAPLSDEELAAVLNYVVDEILGMTSISEFTQKEVKYHRARPLLDVAKMRIEILETKGD